MLYLYVNKYVPKTAVCIYLFSTSNCHCKLFSKKIPIIRIFRITGRLAVQINPDQWISTVLYSTQGGGRNVVPFYHPIKIVTSQYRCCKRASECCSSWKMRQMSPVCKMADNGRLTVDQKVKVVLFYAETKSVVATQRRKGSFARGCEAKRWSH